MKFKTFNCAVYHEIVILLNLCFTLGFEFHRSQLWAHSKIPYCEHLSNIKNNALFLWTFVHHVTISLDYQPVNGDGLEIFFYLKKMENFVPHHTWQNRKFYSTFQSIPHYYAVITFCNMQIERLERI